MAARPIDRLTATLLVGAAAALYPVVPHLSERSYAGTGDGCDLGSISAAIGGLLLGAILLSAAVVAACVLAGRARVALVLVLVLPAIFLTPTLRPHGPHVSVSPCGDPLSLLEPLLFGVVAAVVTFALARRRPRPRKS